VPIGRVFVFTPKEKTGDQHKQKIILAGHAGKELTASAEATCTKAAGGLPVTGAPVAGTVAAGFALLSAGAGLFLVRRRRIKFTA
jgi:LPXTG-motif cell wall-anchored protein